MTLKELPPAGPIADLKSLSSEKLYVFVLGPGEGEAIAVALPHASGWLLFDGCRSGDGGVGLIDVLEQWRRGDEPILCYALTHPHTDHAKGIVDLVEQYGSAIQTVAITPPWATPHASKQVTSQHNLARQVRDGLIALDRLCAKSAHRIDLVTNAKLPTGGTTIKLRVLGPSRTRPKNESPNDASAVVELTFGTAKIVLGSDLPTKTSRGKGGWSALCARHPGLGEHLLLKIPHHGSSTSHHAPLFQRHRRERAWPVTPFNSHSLPNVVRMDGLEWILRRGEPVLLTAPPVSKDVQVPVRHPGIVRRGDMAERIKKRPTKRRITSAGAIDATPVAIRTRDSLWCFQIDAGGRIDGRWRGDAALEIVP